MGSAHKGYIKDSYEHGMHSGQLAGMHHAHDVQHATCRFATHSLQRAAHSATAHNRQVGVLPLAQRALPCGTKLLREDQRDLQVVRVCNTTSGNAASNMQYCALLCSRLSAFRSRMHLQCSPFVRSCWSPHLVSEYVNVRSVCLFVRTRLSVWACLRRCSRRQGGQFAPFQTLAVRRRGYGCTSLCVVVRACVPSACSRADRRGCTVRGIFVRWSHTPGRRRELRAPACTCHLRLLPCRLILSQLASAFRYHQYSIITTRTNASAGRVRVGRCRHRFLARRETANGRRSAAARTHTWNARVCP
jgi:hypothetical protein